jgi:hypothetical protein
MMCAHQTAPEPDFGLPVTELNWPDEMKRFLQRAGGRTTGEALELVDFLSSGLRGDPADASADATTKPLSTLCRELRRLLSEVAFHGTKVQQY